jgi:hypothetical protein
MERAMADGMLTSEEALARLAETPQRIAALTADLTPLQAQRPPSTDEWAAVELLAHLRACSDVWGSYIARILTEDHPTIRVINPRTYIRRTNYSSLDFQSSLRAYLLQREGLLADLRPLSPEQWTRGATITGAGALLELTVQSYVSRLARHEHAHVRQFQEIVTTVAAPHS